MNCSPSLAQQLSLPQRKSRVQLAWQVGYQEITKQVLLGSLQASFTES